MSSRTRVLFYNIVVGLAGRALNLFSTLIIVPVSLAALGPDQYGLLAIIISLSVFFAYADFGLGSALVNDVASGLEGPDPTPARIAISQVWFFLVFISALVIGGGLAFLVSGGVALILPQVPQAQLVPIWLMLVVGAGLGVPFAIAQRIYFALQRGVVAQAWVALTRLAVLLGVVVAYVFAANLEAFVFAVIVVPTVISGTNVTILFAVRGDLRPSLSLVQVKSLAGRAKVGLTFAIANMFTFAEIGLDPLLLAQRLPLEAVAANDVVVRLFSYVPSLLSIALVPLWPALSSALANNEKHWATRTNRLTAIGTAAVAVAASAGILVLLDPLLQLWLGHVPTQDQGLRAAIAAFIALQTFGLYQLYAMNALGLVRASAVLATVFVAVVLPVKIMLIHLTASITPVYLALIGWYLVKLPISQYLVERRLRSSSLTNIGAAGA